MNTTQRQGRGKSELIATEERTSPTDSELQQYLRDIGRYPLLTADEEQDLGRRVAQGDEEALQALVNGNLRLVVKIAKGYHSAGHTIMDLIQEGNLGLMRTSRKFDYRKGCKFSTYATWWIRQAITRAIGEDEHVMHRPSYIATEIRQVERITRQLTTELGHDPTIREIAVRAGMTETRVVELSHWAQGPLSLDKPLELDKTTGRNAETMRTLGDTIEDSSAADAYERVDVLREKIDVAMQKLTARERRVIRLRYGLDDGSGERRTLEMIGADMGVTRERIRQHEQKALLKLKGQLSAWSEGGMR